MSCSCCGLIEFLERERLINSLSETARHIKSCQKVRNISSAHQPRKNIPVSENIEFLSRREAGKNPTEKKRNANVSVVHLARFNLYLNPAISSRRRHSYVKKVETFYKSLRYCAVFVRRAWLVYGGVFFCFEITLDDVLNR